MIACTTHFKYVCQYSRSNSKPKNYYTYCIQLCEQRTHLSGTVLFLEVLLRSSKQNGIMRFNIRSLRHLH